MQSGKFSIISKAVLISAVLVCLCGIILNHYIPSKIIKETATLSHTPVMFEMSVLQAAWLLAHIIVLISVVVVVITQQFFCKFGYFLK